MKCSFLFRVEKPENQGIEALEQLGEISNLEQLATQHTSHKQMVPVRKKCWLTSKHLIKRSGERRLKKIIGAI